MTAQPATYFEKTPVPPSCPTRAEAELYRVVSEEAVYLGTREHLIFSNSIEAAANRIAEDVTFQDLLDVYFVHYLDEFLGARGTLCVNILATLGCLRYDFDEFVTEVALFLARHPARERQLAEKFLPFLESDGMKLIDSPAVALLSASVCNMVLFPDGQRGFFHQYRIDHDKSLTDGQLDLALVLIDNWPGTVVTLFETVKLLRPEESAVTP